MTLLTALLLLQAGPAVLENSYVRVSRNAAPCAAAGTAGCGGRVVVALGAVRLGARKMSRGDIAVFQAQESYPAPGGDYLEVAVKPMHPPVKSPAELIAPDKNTILYDGEQFFVFQENLEPGETRARHSHSQRVVIVLNQTRLQQWPDGGPPIFRDQIPDDVRFNEPVIHVVKTVGDKPLRNIVIEFKPERKPD
jgi:hypothetical protein